MTALTNPRVSPPLVVRVKWRRRLSGIVVFGLVITAFCSSLRAAPAIVFDDQRLVVPMVPHSTLIPTDFNALAKNYIRDDTFGMWIEDALTKPNAMNTGREPRVGDATLTFQQCFGGGFLDDMDTFLTAPMVKWVGGSASKHNQPSWGQNAGPLEVPAPVPLDRAVNDLTPMSYWTRKLDPELLAANKNADSIEAARVNDPYGSLRDALSPLKEDGQLLYRNNGENIKLKDGAGTRYAVLFAGLTDAERHSNNVNRVYQQLRTAWGAAGKIYVLFGDAMSRLQGSGAMDLAMAWGGGNAWTADAAVDPGTAAKLQARLIAIRNVLTTDDQFFFYASDHGGNTSIMGGGNVPGAGGPPMPLSQSMNRSMFKGMQAEPDNEPNLSFEYQMSNASDLANVFANGNFIGQLLGSATSATLPVSESYLRRGTNRFTIQTLVGSSFDIYNSEFFTGALSDNPQPVPEPAAGVLLLCACAISGLRYRPRWSRSSRTF